jgi:hypothetical protein
MDYNLLISGYKKVLSTLYSPRHYYERVRTFLKEYIPPRKKKKAFRFRPHYFWGLLLWTLICRPRLLPQAVTLSIYGFHFRKVFEKNLSGGRH